MDHNEMIENFANICLKVGQSSSRNKARVDEYWKEMQKQGEALKAEIKRLKQENSDLKAYKNFNNFETTKLWLVTSDTSPAVIIKANSIKDCKEKFFKGIIKKSFIEEVENSLKIQELTIPLLDSISPEEFTITKDASF